MGQVVSIANSIPGTQVVVTTGEGDPGDCAARFADIATEYAARVAQGFMLSGITLMMLGTGSLKAYLRLVGDTATTTPSAVAANGVAPADTVASASIGVSELALWELIAADITTIQVQPYFTVLSYSTPFPS
jgi:hypothetical protein